MEETGGPKENHRLVASHRQTLSHNVASSTPRLSGFELTTLVVKGTDCIGNSKSPHDHNHDSLLISIGKHLLTIYQPRHFVYHYAL